MQICSFNPHRPLCMYICIYRYTCLPTCTYKYVNMHANGKCARIREGASRWHSRMYKWWGCWLPFHEEINRKSNQFLKQWWPPPKTKANKVSTWYLYNGSLQNLQSLCFSLWVVCTYWSSSINTMAASEVLSKRFRWYLFLSLTPVLVWCLNSRAKLFYHLN